MSVASGRRRMVLVTRVAAPVLILALGVGVYALLVLTRPQMVGEIEEVRPPEVLVFRARPLPVPRQWRAYGTAEADIAADVAAEVTARVRQVPPQVDPGQHVAVGDLLVKLDVSDFQQQLEQAAQAMAQIDADLRRLEVERQRLERQLTLEQRDLAIAQRNMERVQRVFARGAATQQDLDAAERALIQAERAELEVADALRQIEPRAQGLAAQRAAQAAVRALAQENLTRAEIRSPIAGRLQAVDVKPGERVAAGQRVARVVSLARIEAPLRLPAAARATVNPGDQVRLTSPSEPGRQWQAIIERVVPEDDPQSRTFTAYALFEQAQAGESTAERAQLLYPGRFVEALVTPSGRAVRVVVPRRSLRQGRVFVVREGVVHSVAVEVEYALEGNPGGIPLPDDQWAVLMESATQALGPEALVIVNASSSLTDGQRVAPVLPEPREMVEQAAR